MEIVRVGAIMDPSEKNFEAKLVLTPQFIYLFIYLFIRNKFIGYGNYIRTVPTVIAVKNWFVSFAWKGEGGGERSVEFLEEYSTRNNQRLWREGKKAR